MLTGASGCEAESDPRGHEEPRGACSLADEHCEQRPEALLVWALFDEAELDVDDEDVVLFDEDACADHSGDHAVCGDSFTAGPRTTERNFRCTASVCC